MYSKFVDWLEISKSNQLFVLEILKKCYIRKNILRVSFIELSMAAFPKLTKLN